MRILAILASLFLVGAVWLYGCDETPLDPESRGAAETPESAPTLKQANTPPTLRTPVMLSGWVYVEEESPVEPPGDQAFVYAECPEGKIPISGGWQIAPPWAANDVSFSHSSPTVTASGRAAWFVRVHNDWSDNIKVWAHAICVDASA
jgi:hypothetical protein